ncbi:MAG: flagellum-specific ATP synthase FliI [Gammaproteobacteria bacterium]|nr:flagellum-specific ATP synthase FliI [Gammaproteobacteria bacterium]
MFDRSLSRIKSFTHSLKSVDPERYGIVNRIVGMTIEAIGLNAPLGSICVIENADRSRTEAQIVGFTEEAVLMMSFSGTTGIEPEARVYISNPSDVAMVGENALGRVINAQGLPIDENKHIFGLERMPLVSDTVNPMKRRPIDKKFDVGIRAINSLLTLGCGQRIGLIAGSGVGKSVLLGMMTKFSVADVIVIGLIGERGREVKEFIEMNLGTAGLRRSVVVAAPSDNSPLLRIRASNLAHSYAEFFRKKGKNVLLLVDSLSRVAHAQREIGLAVGEAPTTKGYPPSVFSLLPKLIERTGTGEASEGTITAIYTVLAEGDDLNDPIVDIARASLDGQISLDRDLADAGHFPAIDISGSVSRLMPLLTEKDHQQLALNFRRMWSIYEENKDLIRVGAYQVGADPELDRAMIKREEVMSFLQQDMHESAKIEQSVSRLEELLHAN